jgi:hypothetical protein
MDDATRAAALERLKPLVGEWTAEFRFSFTPEPTAGWLAFAWELGGQFLLERSGGEHPSMPSGLCVISVAEEGDGHEYVQHYFDSRGVVRVYRMTLRDGVWQLVRDRPDFTPLAFHQRYTGRFSDDGRTIDGQWEASNDGGATWETDFGLTFRRAS